MLLFGMSYICLQIFQLIGISHTHFLSYNPRFNVLTRKIIIGKINHVINTDYKLDKRIDGIEADWVYSAF